MQLCIEIPCFTHNQLIFFILSNYAQRRIIFIPCRIFFRFRKFIQNHGNEELRELNNNQTVQNTNNQVNADRIPIYLQTYIQYYLERLNKPKIVIQHTM